MASVSGLHHASLSVSDVDASTTWYCEVLGLAVAFREEGDGRRAAVLRSPDGRFAVGLTEHGARRERFDPTHIGLDHLAFSVDSLDDLHAWATRLAALGVESSGVIDIPPGAILNVKDPDGIALALFWDRPSPPPAGDAPSAR